MDASFQQWSLVFGTQWGPLGIAVIAGFSLLAVSMTAHGYRRLDSWLLRAALLLMRIISVAAVLMVVLQPSLRLEDVTRLPNHVALVVDQSRSMTIRETGALPPRINRALAVLESSQAQLARWRRHRLLDFYGFGTTLRRLAGPPFRAEASDATTDFRQALTQLRDLHRAGELGGVLMISDGVDNTQLGTKPLAAAQRQFVRELGCPIYTALVGQANLKDLLVAEIRSDTFAFVRNAVRVEAEIGAYGLDGQDVVVTLEEQGRVMAQRTISIKPGTARYVTTFEFVPDEVGSYVYTVRVPELASEALYSNNSKSFVLRVIRDRIRVLQICGQPSWDQRFLRDLLKRDPNVDLISFFILRTPTDLTLVPTSELSLIPFPTQELFENELGSFDLVILQNFNYGPYGIGMYLPQLARFVEHGGGLAMIGGALSFSSGGYYDTPLARVLPVQLLPPTEDPSRLLSTTDFRMQVTGAGLVHPVLQVAPTRAETEQVLAKLPELAGSNIVGDAAPGATVLAVHPSLRTERGAKMPVLATREVGKGRTLSMTSDSSWHFAFLAVGQGETRRAYDRFYRNAIRWLIRDPELKLLKVSASHDIVRLGGAVKVLVRAFQPDYRPALGLPFTYSFAPLAVQSTSASKSAAALVVEQGSTTNSSGERELVFHPTAVGAHRFVGRATIGDREVKDDAVVLVEAASAEEREPRASSTLLKELAERSKGRYLGEVTSLPDISFPESQLKRVNSRRAYEVWSRWWFLAFVLALLPCEWWIRRRAGLL